MSPSARTKLRIAAGIIAGFGVALGGIAAASLAGLVPLEIDFFGVDLDTRAERLAWLAVWSFVAVVGVVAVVALRPRPDARTR